MNNSGAKLSFRDMNLAIFRGEDPGGVLWQPRLEYWYDVNKKRGTLPEHLKEASLLDVYDYCHASVRYFTQPLCWRYKNVQVTEQWEDEKRLRRTWETPVGTLTDVKHSPVQILNFGENIDAFMVPPPIWNKHLAPYYRKRIEQLHAAAGKFLHIHVDGTMKPLLPHLRDCPWDGIEAATPVPQGDVTLEELKGALGDRVLLDGIPALYFLLSLSPNSTETLIECVKQVVGPGVGARPAYRGGNIG